MVIFRPGFIHVDDNLVGVQLRGSINWNNFGRDDFFNEVDIFFVAGFDKGLTCVVLVTDAGKLVDDLPEG